MTTWRFDVQLQPWSRNERLYITRDVGNHRRAVMLPFQMHELEPGAAYAQPSLEIPFEEVRDGLGGVHDFLQAAMDAAYELGMWPKGAPRESPAELAAVRYHLEDMRKIAKVPGAT